MKVNEKTQDKLHKIFAILAVVLLIVSILPILQVSFYDRATGDDYNNGAIARQTFIQTRSLLKTLIAVIVQVKSIWESYQGTWISDFLFALQPEVFSLKAYWITAWIALILTISSVSYFMHIILVDVMGWHKEEFIIVDCSVLVLMLQFVQSPRSALFWYTGMVHYVVPLALALFSMGCFIRYVIGKKVKYIIVSSILMTFLGGMSYLSAFMAPLFLFLIWILTYKRGKYVWKLAIPLVLECIGLIISAIAPGNAVRGGSGYSVSLQRAMIAVGKSIQQGTISLPQIIINKPMVVLILLFATAVIYNAQKRASQRCEYPKPFFVCIWLYLIYCAMYWPGIFSGVDVSAGVPNTIFQVGILMFIIGMSYSTGYLITAVKINDRFIVCIWTVLVILVGTFTYIHKGTLKTTTDYVTIEYLRSGQADDYKEQMDDFTEIMTNPTITDAKVHASNCEQGPLMHMPITGETTKYTNLAAAKFFGKNSVVSVD